MHSINILDYTLRSAQGNTKETLKAIQTGDIKVSFKNVVDYTESLEIPYFLFKEEVLEEVDSIKQAIKEIVQEISEPLTPQQRSQTALIVGTSLIDHNLLNAVIDTVYDQENKPYYSEKKSIDSFAQEIAQELGLNSFTMTINTACTSSANAMIEARNLIYAGVVDYAIVLGVEIFSQTMSNGFSSMRLLSLESQKPFDTKRDGLVLGEAIAAVLIGKEKSSWSLRGGYSNCNSFNITSVGADGEEYAEVMQEAMRLSEVSVDEICVLKAHATSTQANDLSEINAIKKLFSSDLTFTGLKPYLGHTLGACGVLELALFISCIDEGFIPKTLNHSESIIAEYVPLQEHKRCESGIFMLNYFGFGGNNTSLIIEKEFL